MAIKNTVSSDFFDPRSSIVKSVFDRSPVENQNDLELDFKVFFFADSCCSDIVFDESN